MLSKCFPVLGRVGVKAGSVVEVDEPAPVRGGEVVVGYVGQRHRPFDLTVLFVERHEVARVVRVGCKYRTSLSKSDEMYCVLRFLHQTVAPLAAE